MTAGRALFGNDWVWCWFEVLLGFYYIITVSHFERANGTTNNYRWSPGAVLSSAGLVVLLIKFCIVITNTGLLIVGWLNTCRGISWARVRGLD